MRKSAAITLVGLAVSLTACRASTNAEGDIAKDVMEQSKAVVEQSKEVEKQRKKLGLDVAVDKNEKKEAKDSKKQLGSNPALYFSYNGETYDWSAITYGELAGIANDAGYIFHMERDDTIEPFYNISDTFNERKMAATDVYPNTEDFAETILKVHLCNPTDKEIPIAEAKLGEIEYDPSLERIVYRNNIENIDKFRIEIAGNRITGGPDSNDINKFKQSLLDIGWELESEEISYHKGPAQYDEQDWIDYQEKQYQNVYRDLREDYYRTNRKMGYLMELVCELDETFGKGTGEKAKVEAKAQELAKAFAEKETMKYRQMEDSKEGSPFGQLQFKTISDEIGLCRLRISVGAYSNRTWGIRSMHYEFPDLEEFIKSGQWVKR